MGKAPQACVIPSGSESTYAVLIMHFLANVDGIQGMHSIGNEVYGTNY